MASPNTLRMQRPVSQRVRTPDTVQVQPALEPIDGRHRRTTPLLRNTELVLPRNTPQRRRTLAIRRAR